MRPHSTAWLTVLALLAGAGCAGSGRTDRTAGASPLDTIHIRSGDTLPPANAGGAGAMRQDTSSRGGGPGRDSTAGGIDTTRSDSAGNAGKHAAP